MLPASADTNSAIVMLIRSQFWTSAGLNPVWAVAHERRIDFALRCVQPQNDAGWPQTRFRSGICRIRAARRSVRSYAHGWAKTGGSHTGSGGAVATDFSKAHMAHSPELAGPGLRLPDLASGVAWPALPRCALFLSVHTAPAASMCSRLQ